MIEANKVALLISICLLYSVKPVFSQVKEDSLTISKNTLKSRNSSNVINKERYNKTRLKLGFFSVFGNDSKGNNVGYSFISAYEQKISRTMSLQLNYIYSEIGGDLAYSANDFGFSAKIYGWGNDNIGINYFSSITYRTAKFQHLEMDSSNENALSDVSSTSFMLGFGGSLLCYINKKRNFGFEVSGQILLRNIQNKYSPHDENMDSFKKNNFRVSPKLELVLFFNLKPDKENEKR